MTFQTELKNYVATHPKLVSMKPAGDGMFVLKYKKTVFFNSSWNRYLEECRGAIVDEDFNLIQYPFTKIYNFRVEDSAPTIADDVEVTVYDKINGFMGAVTWHNDALLVSTTGSTDSDFVGYANDFINQVREQFETVCKQHPSHTWMFECCHPADPHIIVENPGLYLLGWREKRWNSKIEHDGLGEYAKQFGVSSPKMQRMTVGELMASLKTVKHEGFVAYTDDGKCIKAKSSYYLIAKALARKKDILALNHKLVDEEFYPLVAHLRALPGFSELSEQDRLLVIREFLDGKMYKIVLREPGNVVDKWVMRYYTFYSRDDIPKFTNWHTWLNSLLAQYGASIDYDPKMVQYACYDAIIFKHETGYCQFLLEHGD